jgi:hypothetical protein
MKIGTGLPNQVGGTLPTVIPGWATSGPARVRDTVAEFADIGADELIFNPTVGDPDEITRLAHIMV